MKAKELKVFLENAEPWQADDAKLMSEGLSAEPDPTTPEWVQWNVKKKMLEDALKRKQTRESIITGPSGPQV